MTGHPPGDHYFSPQPHSASAEREVRVAVDDREFVFRTDAGVFSDGSIDRGTRLLIAALPLPLTGDVLDWGAGYGPIGAVVAALSPAARVVMAEINERAAALARRNVELNGISNAEVLVGDAFEAVGDREFDFVVTNPPIRAGKQVVSRLIRDARGRLRCGGELWIVIRTQAGGKSYFALLRELFPEAERVAMRGGYRVFRACVSGDPSPHETAD
jgi:16S rRNA (guanine1207-N2)-methyltransferase